MNKTKQIKEIKKKINKQINKSNESIKLVKSIKKWNYKISEENKYYFNILLVFFLVLFLIFFIYNVWIKNNLLDKFDSSTNKNTILKLEEKLIENTIYLSNAIDKIELNVWNIWGKDINIINPWNKKNRNDIYCDLSLNDFENKYFPEIVEISKINKNEISKVFFQIDSSKLKENWYIEIELNCSQNWKTYEKYSNKINFEYKKLTTKDKNILILNATLKPISQSFINIYNIYNLNWNSVKYMSSVYKSDLKNFNEKDLKNKIAIYYKKWLEDENLFKNMFSEIKKIDDFSYFTWYEIFELNYNNLNKLYFLWNCEDMENKCIPYLSYENLWIYYNYFSSKMLLNEKNNIDYIIVLGDKYN